MNANDAIAEASRIHSSDSDGDWPGPLIATFASDHSASETFLWLSKCVGELLSKLGNEDDELTQAIELSRQYSESGISKSTLEKRAWELWPAKFPDWRPRKAVAQLLFAQLRSDPNEQGVFVHSCATPIILLHQHAKNSETVFSLVINHFRIHAN